MSSTNKTDALKLNSWVGADVPKREDFNNDNRIIDEAIFDHTTDTDIHITSDERIKWNSPCVVTTYYGTGVTNRNITLDCDFTPSCVIVFAMSKPLAIADFENQSHYDYCAIATQSGGTLGLKIDGNHIVIQHSNIPVQGYEFKTLNEQGTTYAAVAFR